MKNIISSLILFLSIVSINSLNAQTIASGNIYSSNGEIVAVYTLHHPSCFNTATGTVSFQLMDASYNVEWVDGSNGTTFKQLYAGDYQFKILLGNSDITYKISLHQPDELTATITQIKEGNLCTLDLEVQGGVAPYTYSWNNGIESQDLNNVGAGFYTVLIKDKNHCTLSLNSKVNKRIKPTLDIKN